MAYSGPTVFLPEDAGFRSFGVVKAPDAEPAGIGLEGLFFPTYLNVDGDPINVMGDLRNPTLSMQAWVGDLGMDDGTPSSVYELDTSKATKVTEADGSMFRVDLQPGQSIDLPDGAGSVTFEGVERWNKLQISRTPGMHVTLAGVVLALAGLLLSLFIRPRRVWVRARRSDGDDQESTQVEVAGLDRSTAGDVETEVAEVVSSLRELSEPSTFREGAPVTDQAWETLSNQAIAAAGIVYFLSLLAYLVQWASLRNVPVGRTASRKVAVGAGGLEARDHRRARRGDVAAAPT